MKHPPTAEQARLSEIFSSIQGEGTCLGQKHLFVRFEECHIHCGYCDELDKGGRLMSQAEVVAEIERLEAEEGPHRYVSLTGGEPLLYLEFIKPLIAELRRRNFKIYLETNGILWRALHEILESVDLIAMDMKPASVTGEANFDREHRKFLEIARSRTTFIKIIVSKEIVIQEYLDELKIVRDTAPETPILLVPLSAAVEGHDDPELMKLLRHLQDEGLKLVRDIRIVPRFHKILKIR